MIGALISFVFAMTFGVNQIITRRGVLRASSSYVANISIFSGPVFFLFVTGATGDLFKLGNFSWESYAFFAAAGVVHFTLGRTFGYKALFLIGTMRANLISSMNGIVTSLLAVLILKEVLTPLIVLGILFSLSGPLIAALKEEMVDTATAKLTPQGKHIDRETLYRGLLYGSGAAIFWGSSPILIKMGFDHGGTSVIGNLTSFSAAALVIAPSLLRVKTRDEILCSDRQCLKLALLSGLTTNIAQLLRFVALAFTSAITVSIVSRTIPVWTLLFALIFNRKVDSFNRWVLIGNALLLLGSFMVIAEQIFRI